MWYGDAGGSISVRSLEGFERVVDLRKGDRRTMRRHRSAVEAWRASNAWNQCLNKNSRDVSSDQ